MHEGEKLHDLLKEADLTYTAFAEACGISKSRVSEYVRTEKFEPVAWDTVCVGLRKLKLDRRRIRPETDTSGSGEPAKSGSKDLRACLEGLTNDQLRNVLTILLADKDSREKLVWVIEDRLERPHHK
jgi:transcriptional regulator with XRE-family HTH domain